MSLRYKIGSVLAVLFGVFLWGRCGHRRAPIIPRMLPPNDLEQIIVDPNRHTLVIMRPTGTQTLTLPDRQSIIDLRKNGTIDVTSKQFGLEHHLFVGITGSDHARVAVGIDGFYWKRLDFGLGIAGQIGSYTPVVFAKATYNIRGSLQLGIVYQSNKYIGGLLAIRVF